jgi:co-chaperonin GroES (HSP10)
MEMLDIGSYKPPLESLEIKKLQAIGSHLFIVKEETPGETKGGIVLPDSVKNKRQKRRGWVLSPGTGYITKHGVQVKPPWARGDYIVADRAYARPDPTEDDICTDPIVMRIDAVDVLAIDPDRRPPAGVQKVIDAYGE